MNQLNKHKLDFDLTWKYMQSDLDKTNTLSSELLNVLDFKIGYFFTLLPKDANVHTIYNFDSGILFPNPIEKYFINGHDSTYSLKSSIRDELAQLILKKFSLYKDLSCIFDEVNFSSEELKEYSLFKDHGLSYQNEAYYLIKKSEISIGLIEECLRMSNAIWHSLCVFTKIDFTKIKILSLEKIKEICLKTELIMIGAYDAEGYIFWEKNLTNENRSFFEHLN